MKNHSYEQILSGTESPNRVEAPIICLGITFANEKVRRDYFLEKLREKLKDPEFRKREGFPLGNDDDILDLSDPPYYTSCPNPWIDDFIQEWESHKKINIKDHSYHREPFAADVSEGKNDPIYNAHSYHTKVPHKAIMRYILHYTEPGDIVFDGFCGTGMTGVAAQMCGDLRTIQSLDYEVDKDGLIFQNEPDASGKIIRKNFSKIGPRRAILNDLSPAATYIANGYNSPVDPDAFESTAKKILKEVELELGWMYETKHSNEKIGKINFTLWSDVFICSECASEIIFWDVAVDRDLGEVLDDFKCSGCSTLLKKRNLERAWTTVFDSEIGQTIKQSKQIPVLINYSIGTKRYEKAPDQNDLDVIDRARLRKPSNWFPSERMIFGQETRRNDSIGVTNIHHFYSPKNLHVISAFREKIFNHKNESKQLGMWFTSSHVWGTRLNRLLASNYFKKTGGVIGQTLQGTLYISSLAIETNLIERFALRISSVPFTSPGISGVIQTCSSSRTNISSESVDYIFVDPPFGSNIMYSELNTLWEKWLKVETNAKEEAIESSSQDKDIDDYRRLMTSCFKEAYRILRPGRWMTVEFSNTKASIWNNIQTALSEAGFVVANVSALEKSHKGYRAVTTPTAVKQDLVISAYKPNGGFEERFKKEASTDAGVWDFVRTHLKYLPVTKSQGSILQSIPERDPRILFDQMVSYYIRMGFQVPMDSREFQHGLSINFIERDGMIFLPEQALYFDKQKIMSERVMPTALFVSDEASAIQWIRQILKEKPQTFQDLNPIFMQQLGGWSKNEQQLDLRELLNQNFLMYDGTENVPDQIHSYLSSNWKELRNLAKNTPLLREKASSRWYVPDLNKSSDLEKIRDKALLREFSGYVESKKKLKIFRLEAVRAGFKKAWQERDYLTIISVAQKIPESILQEDPKLLMWYDQAITRSGA